MVYRSQSTGQRCAKKRPEAQRRLYVLRSITRRTGSEKGRVQLDAAAFASDIGCEAGQMCARSAILNTAGVVATPTVREQFSHTDSRTRALAKMRLKFELGIILPATVLACES
jgi:hypothetical protein